MDQNNQFEIHNIIDSAEFENRLYKLSKHNSLVNRLLTRYDKYNPYFDISYVLKNFPKHLMADLMYRLKVIGVKDLCDKRLSYHIATAFLNIEKILSIDAYCKNGSKHTQ